MSFQKQVKRALVLNNMNQRELADEIGVTEATISRWLHGSREPKHKHLIALGEALNVSVSYLFQDNEADCEHCEHYDPEERYCMAFECNGLECAKLPCEE